MSNPCKISPHKLNAAKVECNALHGQGSGSAHSGRQSLLAKCVVQVFDLAKGSLALEE